MSDEKDLTIPVSLETFIPPAPGPDGQLYRYDLDLPHLRAAMNEKIQNNVNHFGSIERFLAQFSQELIEKRDAAEAAVRTYHMRRIQMEYLSQWVKANSTIKDPALDG